MASHAYSNLFSYYQDSLLKTAFWGKSMELNNIGNAHLVFPALDEHYYWPKVTTSMRNIFSTGRYLEHHGTVVIKSKSTGFIFTHSKDTTVNYCLRNRDTFPLQTMKLLVQSLQLPEKRLFLWEEGGIIR